jgi:Zn-dependent peptidase ImmA (M78 family)/transcriptional regulator with XRE-family HTH domain
MMTVSVEPLLLTWARERASLTTFELARRIGIKRVDRVEEWLHTGQLPLKKLEAIAQKTHVPLGYLFLATPPDEALPIPDFRTVQAGAVRRPSPELTDTLNTCILRQTWYREYLDNNGVAGPDFLGRFTTESDPVTVASDIRAIVGWTAEARAAEPNLELVIGRFAGAIEDVGVLVMRNGVVGNNTHRALDPNEFRGFAMFDALAPLIFVNAADAKAAQMFTLAHELAHVWIGQSALEDVSIVSDQPLERFCNQVAAELLVPASEFAAEWRGLDSEGAELQRLSRRFRVSRFVILIRAKESGLITDPQYQAHEAIERNRGFRLTGEPAGGGNFYYTQRSRLGRRFATSVLSSAQSGTTLMRDAYELLGIKRHETYLKLAQAMEAGV